MEPKYPSRSEIDAVMQPTIEELDRQRIIVEYEDPPTAPIHYRLVVREKGLLGERCPNTNRYTPVTRVSPSAPAHRESSSVPPSAQDLPTQEVERQMLADFKRFLDQARLHPEYNMRQHAEGFGSSEAFYRIRDYAQRKGWVTEQKGRVAKTGRCPKHLRLTPAGQTMLEVLCTSPAGTKPPSTGV